MELNNSQFPFPLFCLGHLAYYKEILSTQNILFDVFETFPKSTYRNHYNISNSQGILKLSIPLSARSSKDKTNQIEIDYNEDWINYHLKSIRTAYQSAPFYIHYIDELKAIFNSKPVYLSELNFELFNWTIKKLDVDLKFNLSDDFPPASENKYWRFDNIPNKKSQEIQLPYYPQQFEDRLGFTTNLSILDLLMNEGPASRLYLK